MASPQINLPVIPPSPFHHALDTWLCPATLKTELCLPYICPYISVKLCIHLFAFISL